MPTNALNLKFSKASIKCGAVESIAVVFSPKAASFGAHLSGIDDHCTAVAPNCHRLQFRLTRSFSLFAGGKMNKMLQLNTF